MAGLITKAIKRQAMPTVIADELRIAITSGKLKPGTALRQEDLAEEFAASRIPVREALRQLEAEGLVSISPNKGATVVSLTTAELQEIFEIRAMLEPAALDFAFPNITTEVLQKAAKLLDELSKKPSETAWGSVNWQFHLLLYDCAKRPKLVAMIDSLRISSERYLTARTKSSDYKSQAMSEHRQILQYCLDGKRKEAVAHLKHHIEESAKHLSELVQSE